jgi:hypothetical protein
MKFKLLSVATLLVVAGVCTAQDYQFFSSAGYSTEKDSDIDFVNLGGQYYFNPIEVRGPFNEFDFLITESNIQANYVDVNTPFGSFDATTLAADIFLGKMLVGGRYSDFEGDSDGELKLGYLITNNFLVDVRLQDSDSPVDAIFSATYQHNLSNDTYLGMKISTDEELNNASLSARYFTAISNGRYYALTFGYDNQDFVSDNWVIGGDYYFNKYSSLGARLGDGVVGISASHFFTPNFSVSGAYNFVSDEFSGDVFSLNVAYQL